jgi:hypothetical protein
VAAFLVVFPVVFFVVEKSFNIFNSFVKTCFSIGKMAGEWRSYLRGKVAINWLRSYITVLKFAAFARCAD